MRIQNLLPALPLLAPVPAAASTWLVPSQVNTVAAAMDSAASGDSVVVSAGAYLEVELGLKSGVTVRGATGDPADVTIDAQGLGRIFDGTGLAGGRLEALTLANGAASVTVGEDRGGAVRLQASSGFVIAGCVFTGNTARFGGAILCDGSSVTIEDCTFDGNHAAGTAWATGGAIQIEGQSPVVRRCTFTGNTAVSDGVLGDGGAIFAKASSAGAAAGGRPGPRAGAAPPPPYSWEFDASRYERCTFEQNDADAGGALYLENSTAKVLDCDFTGNTAENGGALFVDQGSDPRILRCRFTGNDATPHSGGAVDAWASTPELRDCSFTGNTSALYGGAVSFNGETDDALVRECTFAGNLAGSAGGAIRLAWTSLVRVESSTIVESGNGAIVVQDGATLLVDRTIVAFGTSGPAVVCTESGTATFVGSDVHGNPGGNWTGCLAGQLGSDGNVSADPLFCDRPGGDYGLTLPDSPCLPQNNPVGALIGRWDIGCGCPPDSVTTVRVPDDHPTISAALAASAAGDAVGVCAGTYAEVVTVKDGVDLIGAAAKLCRVEWPGGGGPAMLRASGVGQSTVVSDLTFDAMGGVAQVVLAESGTTGLHLQRNVITGGQTDGIVNGPDSFVRIGGALEWANDIRDNGGTFPRDVRNLNVVADSLDALLNYWGTQSYASILARIEGKVRSCPITDSTHTEELCAPLSALSSPEPAPGSVLGLAVSPNPFRASCRVAFSIARPGLVRVGVYDVRGRRVARLHRGLLPAGRHAVAWNGRDDAGRPTAAGIYFVRAEAGPAALARKLVRLR